MGGRVFISYRRDDARAEARSIDQKLRTVFGSGRIFFDVDTIGKGKDFRKVLTDALKNTSVLLAVIGPNWITSRDARGKRRIDDPDDFVQLEIANALKRDVPVIPVLVGGAKMPTEAELPASLHGLVFRQAATVTHENFPHDMEAIEREIIATTGLKPRADFNWRRVAMGLAGVVLVVGGGLAGASMLGVRMPWKIVSDFGASDDPARLAADRARAEAELKRVAAVEARLKAEARKKAEEAAVEAARRDAKRQADAAEAQRKVQEALQAKLESERQQQVIRQAELDRKRYEAEAATARQLAEQEEAARKAAEQKILGAAAEDRRRAEEAVAKRIALEEEARRRGEAARLARPLTFRIGVYHRFNNLCRVEELATIEVVKAPGVGTLEFREEEASIVSVISEAVAHCVGKRLPGRAAYFVIPESKRDATGTDGTQLRVRYGTNVYLYDYEIDLGLRSSRRTRSEKQK
jgi:hypothetical protein